MQKKSAAAADAAAASAAAAAAAAKTAKTTIGDDKSIRDVAVLKMIGFIMRQVNAYLIDSTYIQANDTLVFSYWDPSSSALTSLDYNNAAEITQLFSVLGYETPPKPAPKKLVNPINNFLTNVRDRIRLIRNVVKMSPKTDETLVLSETIPFNQSKTTTQARYDRDMMLFYKQWNQKPKPNFDDEHTVATNIATDIWSNKSKQEQEQDGEWKGIIVFRTLKPKQDWFNPLVAYFEPLVPVFKNVFEAPMPVMPVEATSPPQPVVAPLKATPQPKPVASASATTPPPIKAAASGGIAPQPPPKPSPASETVIRGKLANKNSTMCYLDAAMQMLLAIPEIPDFFAKTTYTEITQLKPITDKDELLLNACVIGDKSKEIHNIKLWKIIFDEIRTKQMVSIKDISISTQNGPINPYWRLVLGCPTNAFLTPKKDDYRQADSNELLTLLFFPNFSCLIIPSINQTVGIITEDTTRNKMHVLSMMLSPDRYNTTTSIARLLQSNAFGSLFPLDEGGNYLIMAINRAYVLNGKMERNQTRVEITREIDIVGVKFRIKGCIFHSGDGKGGHYVYGVYDDAGNPHHVIDDLQKAQNVEDVFTQREWMSTTCLYRKVQ